MDHHGDSVVQLPEGFVPRELWPEYGLAHHIDSFLHPESLGTGRIRWKAGPVTLEEHWGDAEPDVSRLKRGLRLIRWQPLTRVNIPQGWIRVSAHPARLEGFVELAEEEYSREWSESARRYRNKWRREYLSNRYDVSDVSYDSFESAYLKSRIGKSIGMTLLTPLKRKKETGFVRFLGAHDEHGVLQAGIAVCDSPSYSSSYYAAGFFTSKSEEVPCMIGLIDHWFADAQERGYRFLHLGNFWRPGDPGAWRGFSRFKAHFGPRYATYPPPLYRFFL